MNYRLFPLLFFAFVSFSLPCNAAQELPKIRVAQNGQGFETSEGRPFVPFGVNYFRPGTGWAPQLWKTFDETAFRADFSLMKEAGVNCVRVFLTYGSFMNEKGKVDPEGLRKFDLFLNIAEEYGIYVHPTGPDHWEGWGCLTQMTQPIDRFADDEILEATAAFWTEFAAKYQGRNVIFAYDLLNEPLVLWDSHAMKPKWNRWLVAHYDNAEALAKAWDVPVESIRWNEEDAPADLSKRRQIADYQAFREEVADHWTEIQATAIRAVDSEALVTVGFIQWSVPIVIPDLKIYAAFRPSRQAKYLDFLEIHFYPLATGFYEYGKAEDEMKNRAYVESVVRETAAPGKPVVVAEFGWYGGGKLQNSNQERPAATEEEQAGWNTALVETTRGIATGWLNWGFFDIPESTDISELLGLYTADRKVKAWGKAFERLSREFDGTAFEPRKIGPRPVMDWEELISVPGASTRYQEAYQQAFQQNQKGE